MTLKDNKIFGEEMEKQVLSQFGESATISSQHEVFDIETPLLLIEVKSAMEQIKNGIRKNKNIEPKQRKRNGRFVIHLNSHTKLLEKAKIMNRFPRYCFVLTDKDGRIKEVYQCTWLSVNNIIERLKTTTLSRVCIDQTKIFNGGKE